MKLGVTVGKLSGEQLKDATKAAIGLAAALDIDLHTAMMLVAKAAAGNTSTLSRYGIRLDENLSAQEKFNQILKTGADNFAIAQAQAKTYTGAMQQMKNAYSDIKEEIGKALMPVFKESAEKIKNWIEEHKQSISNWATRTVNAVILIKDVFADFISFMKNDFKGGMKFAFDSFITIMKAAMESAVALAIAGGNGIWKAIKGVFSNKLDVNTEALKRYNAAGYGSGVVPSTGLNMFSGPRVVRYGPDNPELLEKIQKEVEAEFAQKRMSEVQQTIWQGVENNIRNAFEDAAQKIIESAPPELKEAVTKSYQEYLARLSKIVSEELPYIPSSGLADTGEEVLPGGSAAEKGRTGGVSPFVSRFMHGDPSTFRSDPVVEVAQNTKTSTAILEKMHKEGVRINKVFEKYLPLLQKNNTNTASFKV